MDLKNTIEKTVLKSSKNKIFEICDLKIDNENFGNIFLLIEANGKIQVKFIKDRGDCWCELGKFKQWVFIENIFNRIKIDEEFKKKDFISLITRVLYLIDKNFDRIVMSF